MVQAFMKMAYLVGGEVSFLSFKNEQNLGLEAFVLYTTVPSSNPSSLFETDFGAARRITRDLPKKDLGVE